MLLSSMTALALLVLAGPATSTQELASLPLEPARARPAADFLIEPADFEARAYRSADGRELVLSNGLVRRAWRLAPNAACIALDDLRTDAALLRAVRPEALVTLDEVEYQVGGLVGQPNHAYLTSAWLDEMQAAEGAFRFVGFELGEPAERLIWKRTRHHAPDAVWPPPGATLRLDFRGPPPLERVRVSVHYELYDGLPVFSKWVTVANDGDASVDVDAFTCELLAVVEHSNAVETRDGVPIPQPGLLHVETDYAFGGFTVANSSRHSVRWLPDPEYHTQVNYRKQTPCLLAVGPAIGPDQTVPPGESFESFRAFELVHDSTERERRGLAQRRMYRTIAPWITENPLILHVVSSDDAVVRSAIDQAAECGFELVSLSFGSGLSMERDDAEYRARFRALAEYAGERGIHLGGYSLLSSRRIQPDTDNCIHPDTGEPGGNIHGFCPALASGWGQEYFRKLRAFYEETGFLQFTHDGSYPGDLDAAARPPLQKGLADSRWVQWKIITGFYGWLRARGAYVRVPDYYYLSGGNECGMGYREVNWSLPRIQQQIHTRQNIFDGTWEKTPSMGWMFVPLTQYHGGGEAATIEPLDEHLDHYETMLASNLGLGVQAVYRGRRLYDTERTRAAVRKWVDWYKAWRDILESDLVHGRRADGRDLDWMLHVNPALEPRGMLVVYNPLDVAVERTLSVDLYYTGVRDRARVRHEGGAGVELPLDRSDRIELPVSVPARGMTWYLVE